MEILQRLQPLDILFAVVWAGIVGWGLQTGVVRQLGMLVAVYAAAVVAGTVYSAGGRTLGLAFGQENLPLLEFAAYVGLFVLTFGVIGVLVQRAYPLTRLSRHFGTDNVLGAALGAIWGVLLLIALLTMMRYYAVVPWREQEVTQLGVTSQIKTSQVAPVLELVAAPLWQLMAPWFPTRVPAQL